MPTIEMLTISGFRGILTPLKLSFERNRRVASMVIYGRNGTGKSSITDAWEWLHAGKIQRLAREGAGERSYPHREAGDGDTFVEVHLSNSDMDPVRLTFDPNRVTIPETSGDVEQFRKLISHPCHIRFEDLTDFVYLKKAEKYDALADLMGFTPQVDFQKGLNRTLRKLTEELQAREGEADRIGEELLEILEPDELQDESLLARSNAILDRHELGPVETRGEADAAYGTLRERVENDPRSRELSDLTELKKACEETTAPEGVWDAVSDYTEAAQEFKQKEAEAVDFLLIDLYTTGREVLEERKARGVATEQCPLCGQKVKEVDLLHHIEEELERLRALKDARDELDAKRRELALRLAEVDGRSSQLESRSFELSLTDEGWPIHELVKLAAKIDSEVSPIATTLETPPEALTDEMLSALADHQEAGQEAETAFESARQDLVKRSTSRQEELRKDDARSRLVNDHELLRDGLDRWKRWNAAKKAFKRLEAVHDDFEAVVASYIEDSIESVEKRFDAISDDVDRFFGILEKHTDGVSGPRLKLLTDQDRAVMLQVEFRGEEIRPAYKYLSESQLNSFGLAVFLASAKRFNPDFPFLLLDDVINSFDAYKRPQVIRLLNQEFPDHQFLILTHDPVWTEQLFETFPGWIRRKITRFTATGPVMKKGLSELEKVQIKIDNDEPTEAGRTMGPFLERKLQELCDAFEVMVKFNRRHEYTLDPLLTRFRVRVKKKLGSSHSLTEAVQNLKKDSGFRNLCAHWKDPAIPLTSEEMQRVVDRWKVIAELVRCSESECRSLLQYDGSRKFVCHCGSTVLEKTT